MADNPPDGAILDYFLAQPAATVTLEIRDARGVVRSYASTDLSELTADQVAAQLIPSYWLAPQPRLATSAGMHRFVWNLRRAPPIAADHEYPITATPHATERVPEGPRVAPGTFTVALVANGKTVTTRLEVRLDPRTKLAASVVAQQNDLEVHLAELLGKSSELVLQTRSVAQQLAHLGARVEAAAAAVAAIAEGPRDPPAGTYSPTARGVNRTIAGLYGAIAVDAAPTAAQLDAARTAERELTALARKWEAWKTDDLVRLNRDLEAGGLAAVRPELHPSARPASGDED
jgi:hypothetical protein